MHRCTHASHAYRLVSINMEWRKHLYLYFLFFFVSVLKSRCIAYRCVYILHPFYMCVSVCVVCVLLIIPSIPPLIGRNLYHHRCGIVLFLEFVEIYSIVYEPHDDSTFLPCLPKKFLNPRIYGHHLEQLLKAF